MPIREIRGSLNKNKMPLQNRVNPFGKIIISPSRGMLMGNRGVIHKDKRIVADFKNKFWITCDMHYKNTPRVMMVEKRWTELFFLDEATAFSAGHRPCAYCRNKDYKFFKSLWLAANTEIFGLTDFSIKAIDEILHAERRAKDGSQLTYRALLSALPNGVIVQLDGSNDCYLFYNQQLMKWSAFGYSEIRDPSVKNEVTVLTPRSMVKIFELGYPCDIHESAKKLLGLCW